MADYMAEIVGGSLWQWDMNRKIKIQTWENESVTEAHFSIAGTDRAMVVDTYKENDEVFANIPNILLQQSDNIIIYLVSNDKTLDSFSASIIPRAKPDDYVYTETEIKNYERLEAKIPTKMSQLEQDVNTDFIITVIREYNDELTIDREFEEIHDACLKRQCIAVNYSPRENIKTNLAVLTLTRLRYVSHTRKIYLYFQDCINTHLAFSEMMITLDEKSKTVIVDSFVTKSAESDILLRYYKKQDSSYSPENPSDLTTKKFVEDAINETFTSNMTTSEVVEVVPDGNYLVGSMQGWDIFGNFKMPIVGNEYAVVYGSIETTKTATAGNKGVRIGDTYSEFIMEFVDETHIYIETSNTGMKNIHITGNANVIKFPTKEEVRANIEGQLSTLKPLVLYAENAEEYTSNSTVGDEALQAVLDGRQILVRTPNADGNNYTAIFSPILTYQLPNFENEYLYLFYLRDEKQDIDLSSIGFGIIPMPIYGELKLKLSQKYNECPLI